MKVKSILVIIVTIKLLKMGPFYDTLGQGILLLDYIHDQIYGRRNSYFEPLYTKYN